MVGVGRRAYVGHQVNDIVCLLFFDLSEVVETDRGKHIHEIIRHLEELIDVVRVLEGQVI